MLYTDKDGHPAPSMLDATRNTSSGRFRSQSLSSIGAVHDSVYIYEYEKEHELTTGTREEIKKTTTRSPFLFSSLAPAFHHNDRLPLNSPKLPLVGEKLKRPFKRLAGVEPYECESMSSAIVYTEHEMTI